MDEATEHGRAWFAILAGIPAILGWVGYGLAILLAPHLGTAPDPLHWAGIAAGGWYLIVLTVAVGPLFLMHGD